MISDKLELLRAMQSYRDDGRTIGFVPTMGALHQGHLSLLDESKKNNDITVASIFVNPTQFSPNEDFSKYPRTLAEDLVLLESKRVDLVFTPTQETMYPDGYSVYIDEQLMSYVMCGKFRPGHFKGVCTIVFKLLALTKAHRLYLGQKDAQQLRILQKMAEDLHLETEILGCPTVREEDGLAMSSRNRYLSAQDRTIAPLFFQALKAAKKEFDRGLTDARHLASLTLSSLQKVSAFKVQYVELRDWKTLEEVEVVADTCILAGALYLGQTRLIDNIFLTSDES